MNQTKSVTLNPGYTDPQTGETWVDVEVKAPTLDDEIKAQEGCGMSTSQSLFAANLINQCCLQFGPKPGKPGVAVIRSLSRLDANRLYAAIFEIENAAAPDAPSFDGSPE